LGIVNQKQRQMKTNIETIAQLLWAINTPTFVSVEYTTEYRRGKHLQKDCPLEVIQKTEKSVFLIGSSYKKGIQNALKKRKDLTTTFEVMERTWGTRLSNSLVEHNGNYYMTVRRLKNSVRSQTFTSNSNGSENSEAIYKQYKRPSDSGDYPKNLVLQQDIKISNVKFITIRGVKYEIE
jgi:hypothetical protein